MTRLQYFVFNIWQFTATKILPKAYKLCQSQLNILPNIFTSLPKPWNFAKSGHTGRGDDGCGVL